MRYSGELPIELRGNLSEVYKYPRTPTDTKVDRLEDRIAQRERNLNYGLLSFRRQIEDEEVNEVIEDEEVNEVIEGQLTSSPWASSDMKEDNSMAEVETEHRPDAEYFRKYVGQIVNDTYHDLYVEVIEIVGSVVAIRHTPAASPTLIEPRHLRVWE